MMRDYPVETQPASVRAADAFPVRQSRRVPERPAPVLVYDSVTDEPATELLCDWAWDADACGNHMPRLRAELLLLPPGHLAPRRAVAWQQVVCCTLSAAVLLYLLVHVVLAVGRP